MTMKKGLAISWIVLIFWGGFNYTAFNTPKNLEKRLIAVSNLDPTHLGKKILCHRPMRQDKPEMSAQKIGSKIVAYN